MSVNDHYGGLKLAEFLAEAARTRGTHTFVDVEALERLLGRVAFVRTHVPEAKLPEMGDAELTATLIEVSQGRDSFAGLQDAGFLDALVARMGASVGSLLAKEAPERVTLPGGRPIKVQYPAGQAPFVASRLQDFFGMKETPRIGPDRTPLVIHLLAPNHRAVQTTTDLAGFWERLYPQVRRELMRRYPRHSWPERP